MIIRTLNSTYELDVDNKRIRRIHGTSSTRITDDWKEFLNATLPHVGASMVVVWAVESQAGSDQVLTKTTLTSPVIEIIDKTEEILN
jgi:hypothetical protein